MLSGSVRGVTAPLAYFVAGQAGPQQRSVSGFEGVACPPPLRDGDGVTEADLRGIHLAYRDPDVLLPPAWYFLASATLEDAIVLSITTTCISRHLRL